MSGKPARVRKRASPRNVALLRVALLALVVGVGVWLVRTERQYSDQRERVRQSLLEELHAKAAPLTEEQKGLTVRVEGWLAVLAGPYEGDFVAEALSDAASFADTLARPLLYVRGPLEDFATPQGRAELVDASFRDALVLCLLDPPADRTEKSLRRRARAALAGGARSGVAAHVHRLRTALVGMRFLEPAWALRVESAKTERELASLASSLHLVPFDEVIAALQSELLLVAMDEPKVGLGPTEIDGACSHYVRVTLIDLDTDTPLLRTRTFVDPGWLSTDARERYASGINSCELALDVRAEAMRLPTAVR